MRLPTMPHLLDLPRQRMRASVTDNIAALTARDEWLLIARLWPNLVHALAGRGGNALNGMRVDGTKDPKLVIDIHVSDLMHEITGVVEGYAAILLAETKWEPTTSKMPTLLVEVASRYGHFVGDDDLRTGFMDDAHEFSAKVTRTLYPRERATYIGPCLTDNCDCDLRAHPDKDTTTCPNCGTTITRTEHAAWLQHQMADRLLTGTETIRALKSLDIPTSPRTVWRWIEKGKLTEVGEDTGLYALTQAIALAKEKRAARTVA